MPRRLAVFAGGFTLEAAELVCAGEPVGASEVVDCLLRLVDKSLVVADVHAEEGRYPLLETIRHYAGEQLLEAGEAAWTRTRHRDWYLALAEEAASSGLAGPDQHVWMRRLETEHDNLRAVIDWSQSDPADAQTELRLCAALGRFSRWRHPTEGRARLREALPHTDQAPTPARTTALDWAGVLEYFYGDVAHGRQLLEEAVAIARLVGEPPLLTIALRHLAAALGEAPDGPAPRLLAEALVVARAAGGARETAQVLLAQSIVARRAGDLTRAHRLAEEAMVVARGAGDPSIMAAALREAGQAAQARGDLALARAALEQALAVFTFHEYGDHVVAILGELGDVAGLGGDLEAARARYCEAVRASLALGLGFPSEMGLTRLAGLEAAAGAMRSAARLFAACHSCEAQSERWWGLPPTHAVDLAAVQAHLHEPDVAAAWAEGQRTTLEQAIASVLEDTC